MFSEANVLGFKSSYQVRVEKISEKMWGNDIHIEIALRIRNWPDEERGQRKRNKGGQFLTEKKTLMKAMMWKWVMNKKTSTNKELEHG